ncbi:hypothetical protein VTL71DRAFT_13023 [Oculimacula yallundae]|uniref:Clr5 domain-containing protein n=1 Tax=Oculimacula yallundae TaxID=86028 RepID=A0ABR4CPX6_9HELO
MEPRSDRPSVSKQKELPKEQWEELKPLIRRLYLDENMTRERVTKCIVEEYDFSPTKRQFLRKISEWGFEKNVKKAERRLILLNSATDEGKFIRGRKLDKAKLDRWSRRDGISLQHHGLEDNETDNAQDIKVETEDVLALMDNLITAARDGERTLEALDDPDVEEMDIDSRMQEVTADGSEGVFNPWAIVNFDSPQLTGLFGALTIEMCDEFSLDNSSDVPNLEDLFEPPGDFSETNTTVVAGGYPLTTEIVRSDIPTGYQNLLIIPEWTTQNRPSIGLSPFPTSTTSFKALNYRLFSAKRSARLSESECRAKMRKLKKMKQADILELVDNMWTFADKYRELKKYSSAESWYRRIVTVKLLSPHRKPLETIEAYLFAVRCIARQGRYTEAQDLHLDLHKKVLCIFQSTPDHTLAILSRKVLAMLHSYHGNIRAEEMLQREILQILLNKFGLRDSKCLNTMLRLAYSLSRGGQHSSSEQLFRMILCSDTQVLGCSPPNEINRKRIFNTQTFLVKILNISGRVAEAAILLKHINETFPDLLSIENRGAFVYHYELAKTRGLQGRSDESEKILRDLLRHQYISSNKRPDIMNMLADLAEANGRRKEEISWRTKTYDLNLETFGPEHKVCLWSCQELGLCYARQELFDDAMSHFQNAISNIESQRNDGHGSPNSNVVEIQSWIVAVKIDKCMAAGFGLVDQGLFKDAILYFEQALDATIKRAQESDGAISEIFAESSEKIRRWILRTIAEESLESCRIIGMDYAAQGLFDTAILHFQHTLETARFTEQTETSYQKEVIGTLQRWIEEVGEKKAGSLSGIVTAGEPEYCGEAMQVDG